MVETPAGVILTRGEAERIHRHLLHCNDEVDRQLRARIKRYLDNDWQERAVARARAVDKWTRHQNSAS